jgi:hypothetical protein
MQNQQYLTFISSRMGQYFDDTLYIFYCCGNIVDNSSNIMRIYNNNLTHNLEQ